MKLIGELRAAIGRGQLRVFYQPVVELAQGAIVGAEAQVRWQHPALGLLAAEQFFGLAEEAGLAGAIDEWVLTDALGRAREWRQLRALPLLVSVNKSALAGAGPAGGAHWRAVLARMAGASAPVALEITEAALLDTRNMLAELSAAGVQLCLDDFGAGRSSIGSLAMVPLCALKIDQSLVHRLDQDGPRALAAGIIGAAHGLGVKVIAEGVENTMQHERLRSIGCDYGQGFLFSQAVAGPRFSELLGQRA